MEGCGLTDTLLKTCVLVVNLALHTNNKLLYETQEYLKVTYQKPKER